MEIKEQLSEILAEVKAVKAKGEEEQKRFGTLLEETKTKLDALQKQADALDVKLAERHANSQPEESLEDFLKKNEQLQKFMRDKPAQGSVTIELDAKQAQRIMERKTLIDSTAVGSATSGVLQFERTAGIVAEARQVLTMRSVLPSRPTELQVIDFVKVNAAPAVASPQTEGSEKAENAVTFTTDSERVQTIATWIPATRQILDDFKELMGYLQNALPYYVDLAEERQLLGGAGTGTDLQGLITAATAFNTSLLPAGPGWNNIDIIGRAIQQIQVAKEVAPSFFVVHPTSWWNMRLTKDSQGRYILGDPMGPVNRADIFGLTPVITTNITSGTFLVGSGSPVASEIRDRMGMQVEIATQHSDYFTKNKVAIRAEKRLANVIYRPASFITGTLNTSPA